MADTIHMCVWVQPHMCVLAFGCNRVIMTLKANAITSHLSDIQPPGGVCTSGRTPGLICGDGDCMVRWLGRMVRWLGRMASRQVQRLN